LWNLQSTSEFKDISFFPGSVANVLKSFVLCAHRMRFRNNYYL